MVTKQQFYCPCLNCEFTPNLSNKSSLSQTSPNSNKDNSYEDTLQIADDTTAGSIFTTPLHRQDLQRQHLAQSIEWNDNNNNGAVLPFFTLTNGLESLNIQHQFLVDIKPVLIPMRPRDNNTTAGGMTPKMSMGKLTPMNESNNSNNNNNHTPESSSPTPTLPPAASLWFCLTCNNCNLPLVLFYSQGSMCLLNSWLLDSTRHSEIILKKQDFLSSTFNIVVIPTTPQNQLNPLALTHQTPEQLLAASKMNLDPIFEQVIYSTSQQLNLIPEPNNPNQLIFTPQFPFALIESPPTTQTSNNLTNPSTPVDTTSIAPMTSSPQQQVDENNNNTNRSTNFLTESQHQRMIIEESLSIFHSSLQTHRSSSINKLQQQIRYYLAAQNTYIAVSIYETRVLLERANAALIASSPTLTPPPPAHSTPSPLASYINTRPIPFQYFSQLFSPATLSSHKASSYGLGKNNNNNTNTNGPYNPNVSMTNSSEDDNVSITNSFNSSHLSTANTVGNPLHRKSSIPLHNPKILNTGSNPNLTSNEEGISTNDNNNDTNDSTNTPTPLPNRHSSNTNSIINMNNSSNNNNSANNNNNNNNNKSATQSMDGREQFRFSGAFPTSKQQEPLLFHFPDEGSAYNNNNPITHFGVDQNGTITTTTLSPTASTSSQQQHLNITTQNNNNANANPTAKVAASSSIHCIWSLHNTLGGINPQQRALHSAINTLTANQHHHKSSSQQQSVINNGYNNGVVPLAASISSISSTLAPHSTTDTLADLLSNQPSSQPRSNIIGQVSSNNQPSLLITSPQPSSSHSQLNANRHTYLAHHSPQIIDPQLSETATTLSQPLFNHSVNSLEQSSSFAQMTLPEVNFNDPLLTADAQRNGTSFDGNDHDNGEDEEDGIVIEPLHFSGIEGPYSSTNHQQSRHGAFLQTSPSKIRPSQQQTAVEYSNTNSTSNTPSFQHRNNHNSGGSTSRNSTPNVANTTTIATSISQQFNGSTLAMYMNESNHADDTPFALQMEDNNDLDNNNYLRHHHRQLGNQNNHHLLLNGEGNDSNDDQDTNGHDDGSDEDYDEDYDADEDYYDNRDNDEKNNHPHRMHNNDNKLLASALSRDEEEGDRDDDSLGNNSMVLSEPPYPATHHHHLHHHMQPSNAQPTPSSLMQRPSTTATTMNKKIPIPKSHDQQSLPIHHHSTNSAGGNVSIGNNNNNSTNSGHHNNNIDVDLDLDTYAAQKLGNLIVGSVHDYEHVIKSYHAQRMMRGLRDVDGNTAGDGRAQHHNQQQQQYQQSSRTRSSQQPPTAIMSNNTNDHFQSPSQQPQQEQQQQQQHEPLIFGTMDPTNSNPAIGMGTNYNNNSNNNNNNTYNNLSDDHYQDFPSQPFVGSLAQQLALNGLIKRNHQ